MKHAEKRANLWYAVLTVPPDVRPIIGKLRYVQSTQTADKAEASLRIALLVAGWRAEIAKARGSMPDPKATFWDNLRRDYMHAQDEGTLLAIEDIAEAAAGKITDPAEASLTYRIATGQAPALIPLAPLVTAWKGSLRLAQKTIDQQHRDVVKMADHFVHLAALTPQKVKAWTDKLIADGATASTLERVMNGCRSLWHYLQDSGTLPVDAPDPFVGSFRLAKKTAKRNTIDRQAFTPKELAQAHREAGKGGDITLSRLIALGAYTGARIEELCSLTLDHCARGVFTITDSKTDAGVRQVPIHPALVALVATMKKEAADDYLIPSTAQGKYGVRSDPLSKRFGRLKESLGFGPGHVFHSIRKTVATMLEQAGVAEGTAADILGHEKKTLSYGLYSSGTSTKQKLEAISKVAYPGALAKP
jgi:integrase